MWAIFEREVKAYATGVIGFLYAAFILLFAGIYTWVLCLQNGYPSFEFVLSNMSFIFLITIPILTMRAFSEERRQKTDQLLYAMPISMSKVVMGKYLAMLAITAVPTVVIGCYPIILTQFGAMALPAAFSSLLSFFLLAASLIAIGMFISSMTENQVVSAVMTFVVVLLLYYMKDLSQYVPASAFASYIGLFVVLLLLALVAYVVTKNFYVGAGIAALGCVSLTAVYMAKRTLFEGLFGKVMGQISVFDRFFVSIDGILDLKALVYMASICVLFAFLTVQSLEKRRWS